MSAQALLRCQVCGLTAKRGRQPPDQARRLRGIVFPARHQDRGRECPGSIVVAEWVWPDDPPPGRPKAGPGAQGRRGGKR